MEKSKIVRRVFTHIAGRLLALQESPELASTISTELLDIWDEFPDRVINLIEVYERKVQATDGDRPGHVTEQYTASRPN
jgi:hypothetical protein